MAGSGWVRRCLGIGAVVALVGLGGVTSSAAAVVDPNVGVGDATVTEGDAGVARVLVPITLESPSAVTVVVGYAVSSSDATAGRDFTSASGTIKFAAGVTQRTVPVTLLSDTVVEPTKHVDVQLTSALGATIADASGTVSIADDDASLPATSAPPEVSVGNASVWEGDSGGARHEQVAVLLSKPATVATSVSLTTTCGTATTSDFSVATKTVTFLAGQRSKTLAVTTRPDLYAEPDEGFGVVASVQSGSATVVDGSATATIQSDDVYQGFTGISRVSDTSSTLGCSSSGGNDGSGSPVVSADGRFVGFASSATNLVPGDTNGVADIFVRDLTNGTVERVSLTSDGTQSNSGIVSLTGLSRDGRFVTLESAASNLVPGSGFGMNAYVVDRLLHTIELAGGGSYQGSHATISDDGRWVAFESRDPFPGDYDPTCSYGSVCISDVFLRDRSTGAVQAISPGSGWVPKISGDGNSIVYQEIGGVPMTTEYGGQVEVYNRVTGTTSLVSHNNSGEQMIGWGAPPMTTDISADGRYIAFEAEASNLGAFGPNPGGRIPMVVFILDRLTGTLDFVRAPSGAPVPNSMHPSISDDGRLVALVYSGEQLEGSWAVPGQLLSGAQHEFVFDRQTGVSIHADATPDGSRPNSEGYNLGWGGALSGDGRVVTFSGSSTDLVAGDVEGHDDVFVNVLW